MSTVGFITPNDPMWTSTLKAMDDELVTDSLVYRYDPEASPDGLRGSEGTFSLCTFAYVESLARAGQLDKARVTFEKMLTYANHLGLYSEEIALTGEQIGNFPQAFTHLALIDAAITLDRQLDLRTKPAPARPPSIPAQRAPPKRGDAACAPSPVSSTDSPAHHARPRRRGSPPSGIGLAPTVGQGQRAPHVIPGG